MLTPDELATREPMPITAPTLTTRWHWLSDCGHAEGRPLNPSWLPELLHRHAKGQGYATPEEAKAALAAANGRLQQPQPEAV